MEEGAEGGGPVVKRRVIAFIGGLDLTSGRYDSPEHPLFKTIGPDGTHGNDFYQPSIEGEWAQPAGVWGRGCLTGLLLQPAAAGCEARNAGGQARRVCVCGGLCVTHTHTHTWSCMHMHPSRPLTLPPPPRACSGLNAARAAPRQPWHDIHAKVEGPAAMDVCLNFMERWAKQAGKLHIKDMHHLDDHGDITLPEGYDVFMVGRGEGGTGGGEERLSGCVQGEGRGVVFARLVVCGKGELEDEHGLACRQKSAANRQRLSAHSQLQTLPSARLHDCCQHDMSRWLTPLAPPSPP